VSVDVALITRQRREDLVRAVRSVLADVTDDDRVIVLENGCPDHSTDGLDELFPRVKWLRSEENLGVAGGRNRLIEASSGEIIAFVDDDATLAPGSLEQVRIAFAADDRLGAVAFRIDDPDTGRPRSHEYPFPGTTDVEQARPCSYFVGAGYALRRRAVDEVGHFDDRLFYALEELDLSFGLVERGWGLRYVPQARVVHHASPEGRPTGQKVYHMVRNRVVVTRRWLPMRYRASHLLVWGTVWLWRAMRSGQLGHYWKGIRDGRRMARATDRRPIGRAAIGYLREHGGRLWR